MGVDFGGNVRRAVTFSIEHLQAKGPTFSMESHLFHRALSTFHRVLRQNPFHRILYLSHGARRSYLLHRALAGESGTTNSAERFQTRPPRIYVQETLADNVFSRPFPSEEGRAGPVFNLISSREHTLAHSPITCFPDHFRGEREELKRAASPP